MNILLQQDGGLGRKCFADIGNGYKETERLLVRRCGMGRAVLLALALVLGLAALLRVKKYFKGSCRRRGCCALRVHSTENGQEKR